MQILSFESSMAAEVARIYNEVTAPIPHCKPAPADVFADTAALQCDDCSLEEILVAQGAGALQGFVHVGIARPATKDWMPQGELGVIRFLACRPGERAVGAALLAAAEAWARAKQRNWLLAWHMMYKYPFYFLPHTQLSQQLLHISALFGMAGYDHWSWSETVLEWRNFVVPALPAPPAGLEIEINHQLGHRGWQNNNEPDYDGLAITATKDGAYAGTCVMLYTEPGWCFCDELVVIDPLQGRGYGKYLLLRALEETHQRGCRHALISTGGTNHRAQLCYANLGYRLIDWTVAWQKKLE
jgi:GNAT superfamily N-acetyltransferase